MPIADARLPTEAIPVVDIFAGPGGLSEGFSSLGRRRGCEPIFEVALSIEKDPVAARTLWLRAVYRHLARARVPTAYYRYIRGEIDRETFLANPSVRDAAAVADEEARCATLGETPDVTIDSWIQQAIHGREDEWVLLGGPPCQAYSLVGRSRRAKVERDLFEQDHRHVLYREYLRIIRRFRPPIFVMENVKGILSARLAGQRIFDQIRRDLSGPNEGLQYEIRSFVRANPQELTPSDFVIRCEDHGVPQARHRVILLGVRRDLADRPHLPLRRATRATVQDVLKDLPPLRSGISRGGDSLEGWLRGLAGTPRLVAKWPNLMRDPVLETMRHAIAQAHTHRLTGGPFVPWHPEAPARTDLERWLRDPRLGGLPNHEARRHMVADLQRYLFAASFARAVGGSPKLRDYPDALLPDHGNVTADQVPFEDRFRVQVAERPASTVVSHLAKDGHYFIHPDPSQARSLTVREAARLQTFPDNYFFEGNRTEQYTQVGNAVPPYLALQLAEVVSGILRPHAVHRAARAA